MISTLTKLTNEQIQHYNEHGYVVVHDLLSNAEIDAFIAGEAERKAKPGFGLHGHLSDPQFRHLATHPNMAGAAMQILNGRVRIVQTMYLDKPPKGTGIALHQDSLYLPNDPNTLMACWVALTDTDGGNGGLCVVPGSQRLGLQKWHKNVNEKEHASWENEHEFRDRDGRTWKQTLVSFEIDGIEKMNVVKLTVPRGAGVFFTGLTIHGSFANPDPNRPRKAFATHYVHENTWVSRTDVLNTMPVELEP